MDKIDLNRIGQVSLGDSKKLAQWDYKMLGRVSLKIFHAVRDPHSELLRGPAEQILSTWDIISTSLVRKTKFKAIGNVGLILKVPVQNILSYAL